MAVHVFWPPLTVLVIAVIGVMYLILKYGDKICKARTTPRPQNSDLEDRSSENTTYVYDEKASYRDLMAEGPEIIDLQERRGSDDNNGMEYGREFDSNSRNSYDQESPHKPHSYECAV